MKPLEDYSDIRGFCYSGGYRVPEEQLKRELGYAGSLRLNSTRIWLSEREYRKAPGDFIKSFVPLWKRHGKPASVPCLFSSMEMGWIREIWNRDMRNMQTDM